MTEQKELTPEQEEFVKKAVWKGSYEDLKQNQWEATVGKNFPLTNKGFETLIAICTICLFVWAAHDLLCWFRGTGRYQAERKQDSSDAKPST